MSTSITQERKVVLKGRVYPHTIFAERMLYNRREFYWWFTDRDLVVIETLEKDSLNKLKPNQNLKKEQLKERNIEIDG